MRQIGTGACALAFGAALTMAAPAAAQSGPSLNNVLPLIEELATQDEGKISDGEIRERSLERGVGTFLDNPNADPKSVFRSYRAYQDEKRALEAQERERKARKRKRIFNAIGGLLGGK